MPEGVCANDEDAAAKNDGLALRFAVRPRFRATNGLQIEVAGTDLCRLLARQIDHAPVRLDKLKAITAQGNTLVQETGYDHIGIAIDQRIAPRQACAEIEAPSLVEGSRIVGEGHPTTWMRQLAVEARQRILLDDNDFMLDRLRQPGERGQ